MTIDGSTDRRCFAIVTNERALLSKLGQPVRKVIQTPHCVFRRVNKRLKTAPFAQLHGAWSISATDTNQTITKVKLIEIYDSAKLESDGATSLKSVVTDSKTLCLTFTI